VIVDVPAATGEITPVEALIVANPVEPDVQVPPAFPFVVKVVVPFEQIACVPLNVPAFGKAVTVTVLVAVAFEQPPVPVTVYVIVDVPAATGEITPVEELIVANPVEPDVQVPPAFPLVVKVVVPFEQIACVPLKVPAFGAVVTVTSLVAVAFEHPPVPVTV